MQSRRKKGPYSELFWSAFFPDFPAMENNSEYGLFLRSEFYLFIHGYLQKLKIFNKHGAKYSTTYIAMQIRTCTC